ncbi:MAG: hypothetical protein OXL37_10185 [Chloroflexota bacterium]|nr:hypothetical protein [Chloroflexota bacterium]MDE2960758.1 hypothetical protein [Chloroflexota bacterium]
MKEFFLNNCVTPYQTTAYCEQQYQTLTTFGSIILAGYLITLIVILITMRMGWLKW